jgi:predicted Zn-dependent protease
LRGTRTSACGADESDPATVYLAPFDDFPKQIVKDLQDYFEDKHGIAIGVLPRVRVAEEAVDPQRRQLIADRLLEDLDAARGADHPDWVVIGLTVDDIMMEDRPDWAFVFSLRSQPAGLAVVSIARMDPRNFREPADDDLLFERAAKMVGKNVGALHLDLPMSDDPASVMYNGLTSLDALDRVDADFVLPTPKAETSTRR